MRSNFVAWHTHSLERWKFYCAHISHHVLSVAPMSFKPFLFHSLESFIIHIFFALNSLSGNICHRIERERAREKEIFVVEQLTKMQVYCNVAMTKPHFYMLRKVRFFRCSTLNVVFEFVLLFSSSSFFLFSGIPLPCHCRRRRRRRRCGCRRRCRCSLYLKTTDRYNFHLALEISTHNTK